MLLFRLIGYDLEQFRLFFAEQISKKTDLIISKLSEKTENIFSKVLL
jgi:hypothetical protein